MILLLVILIIVVIGQLIDIMILYRDLQVKRKNVETVKKQQIADTIDNSVQIIDRYLKSVGKTQDCAHCKVRAFCKSETPCDRTKEME